MASTQESVGNVGLLIGALLYTLVYFVPFVRQSTARHSSLQRTFGEHYNDFSSQDPTARVASYQELTSEFQKIINLYFEAPSRSAGSIRHLVSSDIVESPCLFVGYRSSVVSSIVEVTIPVAFGRSVDGAMSDVLASHLGGYVVTAKIQFRLVVGLGSSAEIWHGEWSSLLDDHHSFMSLRGTFSKQSSDTLNLGALVTAIGWLAACLVLWRVRCSTSVSLVACLHSITAACCLIVEIFGESESLLSLNRLLLSASCFTSCTIVSWITLPSVCPSICIVQRALTSAAIHLWWYAAGVAPIFFAFAVAGSVLFASDDTHFGTVPRSIVTLFCTIFGDSLIDVFTAMDDLEGSWVWWILSRCYFASFLGLFITTILNVALSVMQDSVAVAEQKFLLSQSDHTLQNHKVSVSAILDLLA